MVRRIRRIAMLAPAAMWAWKQRHVLAGMAGFARTVPDRMRLGRGGEVGLAAKVSWALLREPRLKGAEVRIGAVQGGDVCLEAGKGAEAAAELARRVVEQVPGVTSVRVQDCSAVPAPTVVAGRGAVEDLADGTVRSPATGDDAPVRV